MKYAQPSAAALALVLLCALPARAQTRRPLDHDAYDRWSAIRAPALAPGGHAAAWVVEGASSPDRLVVRDLDGDGRLVIPRGSAPHFTADGRRLVVEVSAHRTLGPWPRVAEEPSGEAGRQDAAPADAGEASPRAPGPAPDTLLVVDLARAFGQGSGGLTRISGGREPANPAADGRWLGYLLPGDDHQDLRRTLVVLDLETGREERIPDVSRFLFSPDGERLWYVATGERAGVWLSRPGLGEGRRVLATDGPVVRMALDAGGRRAAALVRDGAEHHAVADLSLYSMDASGKARRLAGPGTEGVPGGRTVNDALGVRFSPDGRRIFFGTTSPPAARPARLDPRASQVHVDVWSWTDAELQPEQILQDRRQRERPLLAVVPSDGGDVVQLEDATLPDVTLASGGDADVGMGVSDLPYRRSASWDGRHVDVYTVDLASGRRVRVLEDQRDEVGLSPTGRWITWWDGEGRTWRAVDTATGRKVDLGAGIPTPLYDELDDHPAAAGPYGLAGWTDDDGRVLVYDRYDVWAVDPADPGSARNVTGGLGRREGARLRLADPGAGPVPWTVPTLLSGFRESDKDGGFYRVRFADAAPERLVMDPHHYGTPLGAPDTDRLLVTRESFRDFPDLWLADAGFGHLTRLSDANPQEADYRWGSAELVSWTSAAGQPLQGILYKPDGFDPSRRYPMIVTFYERSSDQLHRYQEPGPGTSISRSFYVSRGYLVFVPDIPYRVGHPGQSVVDAVVPGVRSLLAKGFVDPARVGLQGHSWGGYQVAYLVTHSDLFTAAEAGAAVVNMTSAYGGIRWGSGASRMSQYEEGQSRIGRTLWNGLDLYLENSPLFSADKVHTPLLLLHNDKDTAVPWEQGIEMFLALRRLGKPVWLLDYNGEEHGLRKEADRLDWTERMQQFFDHYLKGAPPPVWMVKGVPASMKGETLGLDLVRDRAVPSDSADGP